MAIELHPSLIFHPGDWLRTELIEPAGLNNTQLAAHLGVTRQTISALLNSRAGLSAEMAIRFEKLFGIKADTLLWMQTAFDLAQARKAAVRLKVKKLKLAA